MRHAPDAQAVHAPNNRGAGPIEEARQTAAQISTDDPPMGRPGRLIDQRSPFRVGMLGASGVAVTIGLIEIIVTARTVLVLVGVALFIAVGLEPVVAWLVRHHIPRWAAVTAVSGALLAITGGFVAAAIPTLVAQASAFVAHAPMYERALTDHATIVGQLNDRFHVQQSIEQSVRGGGSALLGGVLGVGALVLNAAGSTLVVVVLMVYFLAALPQLRTGATRLMPHSRRPRMILLTDEIANRVGGYVLGTGVISLIAGTLTFIWLLIFGVPYPLLLAIGVALLDLVPVVGSTVAGVVVSLVALSVSLPVAGATAGFFIAYRFAEDYLLVPKIIGRTVRISSLGTLLAVLVGGAVFGVIGALVAIPVAAAIQLIIIEVAIPRLDHA
jgi:predicted PurR-regulated permease PerM